MHNMKTLLSLLTILSLMFISCSALSVELYEDNKIADRPITPKEMQRMMERGFDVQWAEFSKKIELCVQVPCPALRCRLLWHVLTSVGSLLLLALRLAPQTSPIKNIIFQSHTPLIYSRQSG